MVTPRDYAESPRDVGPSPAVVGNSLDVGLGFAVREGGRTVAAGTVTELLD